MHANTVFIPVLDDDEQLVSNRPSQFGIDDEIALLRTKIKSVLRHDPKTSSDGKR